MPEVGRRIDGRAMAADIRKRIRERIDGEGLELMVSSVIVGGDDASYVYLRQKERACKDVGIDLEVTEVPSVAKEDMVLDIIEAAQKGTDATGIIVELPLPDHMDVGRIATSIDPDRDLDGMNPVNYGRLLLDQKCLAPSTPLAVMEILDDLEVELEGAEVTVVSHSNIVGKPLALMLLNRNATVRVAHVFTKDLGVHTRDADVLVTAAGVPDLISPDMVKEGAVVIDVSMNRVEGRLCGDVAYDEVRGKTGAITPVPGGVGPVTVAMLLRNTLTAYDLQEARDGNGEDEEEDTGEKDADEECTEGGDPG